MNTSVIVKPLDKVSPKLGQTDRINLIKKNINELYVKLMCDVCQEIPSDISWCGSCWNKFNNTNWSGGPHEAFKAGRYLPTTYFCVSCKPIMSVCSRCEQDLNVEPPPIINCIRSHDVVVNCPKCKKCDCGDNQCAKCIMKSPEKVFRHRLNDLKELNGQLDVEFGFWSQSNAPKILTDIYVLTESTSSINNKKINFEVMAGETFDLICRVSNGPMTWFRNGVPFKTDTWVIGENGGWAAQLKSVRVYNCTINNSGDYIGKSSTKAGKCETSVIHINVI